MKTVRSALKPLLVVAAVLCCFLIGCVSQRQYRTSSDPVVYNSNLTTLSPAMIEYGSNYTMGYVEFDDQGWLYGNSRSAAAQQLDTLINRFKAEAETNGLLMVVFVHGWKHNASSKDGNVESFHEMLAKLGETDRAMSHQTNNRPQKRVVGLYVGWRGLSCDLDPFMETTFWDRKNTAEVVGHGAVVELLTRLEDLRNEINRAHQGEIERHERMSTKLLILGHSFGGDIVFSATKPVMIERMVENVDSNGVRQTPRTLGDLVVLINPAFEAARYQPLQDLAAVKSAPASPNGFPPGTNCTLAIFTSTGDSATGFFFPIGRRLSTFFEAYENKRQGRQNITAVGHYEPFITHTLKPFKEPRAVPAAITDTSPAAAATRVLRQRSRVRAFFDQKGGDANALTIDFPGCQLAPTSNSIPNDPVFNVAVDKAIIPDHDSIWGRQFLHFLVEFLFEFSSGGEK